MEENISKDQQEDPKKSAFIEASNMNQNGAVNVLIQASLAAQSAGVLTVRDSILLGAAIELITKTPV